MSSVRRPLEGDVLVHHLPADQRMIDPALLAEHGRSARTLVKEGPLRLTIVALAAGSSLPQHAAPGPVMLQVVEGALVFKARGHEYPLTVGDVMVMAPGVEHSAHTAAGAAFLLTVVQGDPMGTEKVHEQDHTEI